MNVMALDVAWHAGNSDATMYKICLRGKKGNIAFISVGEVSKLNKSELVQAVAEKTMMTKKDVGIVVEAVFEVIQDALSQGDKVQLVGFGNFEIRERAARKGRNPQTGELIDIAASKIPAFRAGKSLRDGIQ